ncbi:MAG: aminodeoxychorismate/anthranilate synthase component II [Methylococcaceae bacterium]|nr:aminodeoxychorismate/anthranilate synthase component II [Methylococcaceae bacterium]MCI0733981.1 aminodeoxychorismate/anthranilate synthase component II [Methylococcaceae bacterium]
MSRNKIVMVDNYDSFTYNLVQYLAELGGEVEVVRNDQITVSELKRMKPDRIVISPGPCTPLQAGISVETILEFSGVCPILGVCLGHQSIGHAFGGRIVRAKMIMHGKTSLIHHSSQGVFSGLPKPFEATRYHSLVIDQPSFPDCLEITAWTQDDNGDLDEIMGVRHRKYDLEGVQFHPESILTAHGHDLLRNFLSK